MHKRLRYLYVVLVAAAMLMAATGVTLTVNLISEAANLRAAFRNNPTGVAAQTDYELLTLIDHLERFGHPSSRVQHQDVIDRFDILWSRLETNSSGATGRYYMALEGAESAMIDLRWTLQEIEPQILALAPDDADAAAELARVLRLFVLRVHEVTLAASSANAAFAASLHEAQRRAGFLAILFLPGMLITGFAVAGILWLERRRLNQLNQTLEKRVAERTAEFMHANERLQQEVDDRRRIEATLRESDERFRDMTANVPGVVYQFKIDAKGTMSVPYVSNAIEPMLGIKANDVVDDVDIWFEAVHPEDRGSLDASIAESHRTLSPWNWEGRLIRPSGEVGWFRGASIPRSLDDGSVLWNGLVLDITETRETEDRLRQSQKMEAVGQLTGGIAHDFNNLLAIIRGNAEVLTDEVGDRSELATIDRAAARGAELTQRLLAFSRRQALRPQSVNLAELITGLNDLMQRTLGAPVKVITHAPDNLWHTIADPGQLENALLNLAINARDAMPGGGILEILCSNLTLQRGDRRAANIKPGEYVQISVRDTGIGMSEHAREHAFEPFFTTKETGQGSGLGLSMVYGFARQSGGDAMIESKRGIGTEVTLLLPRAGEPVTSQTVVESDEPARGHSEVVLVLEDEPDVLDLAVAILERLDYEVLRASDATSAMQVLEAAGHVDLLLSDVVLPGGVSGPEFAAKAKALYPHLRIVFMSGYVADSLSRDSRKEFDEVLLRKPFRRAELARVMQEALAG